MKNDGVVEISLGTLSVVIKVTVRPATSSPESCITLWAIEVRRDLSLDCVPQCN